MPFLFFLLIFEGLDSQFYLQLVPVLVPLAVVVGQILFFDGGDVLLVQFEAVLVVALEAIKERLGHFIGFF